MARRPSQDRSELLDTRVSVLLEAAPAALGVLVAHGFTPLADPLTRRLLAPTVTLAQALRLRGLSDIRAEALLQELEAVMPCRA